MCQHPHLCCRSQLPHPASPRGECAHRVVCVCVCVARVKWCGKLVCSSVTARSLLAHGSWFPPLHRWAPGRTQLCCSYIPTSWSLCLRKWATCRSSKSSISATTSEPRLTVFTQKKRQVLGQQSLFCSVYFELLQHRKSRKFQSCPGPFLCCNKK